MPTADDALLAEIDKLIEQLGNEDFERREESTRRLNAIGFPALKKLRNVLEESKDPEIRNRVRQILGE